MTTSPALQRAPRATPHPIAGRRLLYVYNDPAFFLTYRLPMAEAARDAGAEVHVAAPPDAGFDEVAALGFTMHAFPLSRRAGNPAAEVRSVAALARLYRRLRPALIEHATIKPVIYGSLAARALPDARVLNHVTGLGYVFADRSRRAAVLRSAVVRAYRLALRLPRLRVVFENRDNLELFVRAGMVRPGDAVHVKGGGTDVERFQVGDEAPGRPRVLLPARMLWHKGVDDFVAAAKLLRAEGVDVEFVLAGDTDPGNPGAIATADLERWHAEGAVRWLGHVADMRTAYADCAIVCLPSKYGEGVPRALIEGAATGRPLVTTDTPGCRDIARHGENGICVPPGDPAAIAAAVRTLVDDPALRRRMGRRGREIAEEEFSLASVRARTLELYAELLA